MEHEGNETDNLKELFINHLKRIDTQALEEAISDTISEMVGVTYNCRIDSIKYTESEAMQPAAQIEMEIQKEYRSFFDR